MRGLHYQDPHPQGKLIRVIHGKIQDVAVDLRDGSDTYGQHISVFLDDMEHNALWVPPGFAHGFLALENGATVSYECTTYYADAWAKDLFWRDDDLGIPWALPPGRTPTMSDKDRRATKFKDTTPVRQPLGVAA